MSKITVSAPGKIHLLGEHAVVYGKPAILAAVDMRCTVTVVPRSDKEIEIIAKTFNQSILLNEKTILQKTINAQKRWLVFAKENNPAILKSILHDMLDYPIICIGEALLYYKKLLSSGFTLTIQSNIPVGCGMGSSSALAVAIAGAVSIFLGEKFAKETINAIALHAEQKKHGFPSGGDTAACCLGGLLWYRKESNELKITQPVPFALSQKIANNFLTIFTDNPVESTGEMVSMVRKLYSKRQKFVYKIFEDQEQLVRQLLFALQNENEEQIIQIIQKGERNLEELGVVSAYVKSLIRKIEKAGGAAKICGGGGITKGTGMLLVCSPLSKSLQSLIKSSNLSFARINLGAEGVREK